MRGEIKRLFQGLGKTMIYVTHNRIEAMTMADRSVLLHDFKIEQQGAPHDLYERPATRHGAGLLGSPSTCGSRPAPGAHQPRRRRRIAPRVRLAPCADRSVLPTGARTYATFGLGGAVMVAELQAHDVSLLGERVELAIDMNRAVPSNRRRAT